MASTEVENPFRPGGELSEEADAIVRNSTISRDKVVIRDPSSREHSSVEPSPRENSVHANEDENGIVKAHKTQGVHFSPSSDNTKSFAVVDGKGDAANNNRVQEDEVKSERITAADPTSPAEVEHVQIKKKKGCCAIC